jgi:type II secretory pathway pseudopilin PulG
MSARKHGRRGFTLVEMMVALTIMLFVVIALISLVLATQSTHLTEGRKLDMNQGARVIEQLFQDSFRSAGSVLSLANTPTLLASDTIPFNGIYPLNNAAYPDGVILASGDPDGMTRSTADFTPSDDETLNVASVGQVELPDGTFVAAWKLDDLGIILRTNGYYVFRVAGDTPPALGDTQLTVRAVPAYYSGLLNTAHYNDVSEEQFGSDGNTGDYLADSPVVRLDYFNIFLVRTEADGTLTLTLSTDLEGVGNVFASAATATRNLPILPNIGDIQIDYLTHDAPAAVWAGSDTTHDDPCPTGSEADTECRNFYSQFFTRNIVSARIYVLLRTEEELSKREGSGIIFAKPAMGDVAAETIPRGRFHYNYMQYEVMIRNFSNVY